jgi:hypothetical protein
MRLTSFIAPEIFLPLSYGILVNGVADIEKDILVLDADMHVDEEQLLLEQGSSQKKLCGFNLHPANFGRDDFVEFDSMINIRPRQQQFLLGSRHCASKYDLARRASLNAANPAISGK